ncbi:RBPJ-interacting and tubulin-associated protein 1 [Aplysia californica]|uniref:RBPJ-interacting and tubulin-associated protein 1 n=1 Tax=Aplysia californica TaxID=6500 RepID=A0ABM0K411_APLCA|nr:RBPJ-interacting and tubulin-associated protein 1 [Aplysia californica]
MDMGGFTVVGSRPPSALSSSRSSSALGKHYGYHTMARKSAVDESLFGSYHHTKLSEEINFKAPWEEPKPPPPKNTFGVTKTVKVPQKKKMGPPLLWCPTPGTQTYTRESKKGNSSLDCSGYMWSTRDQYRHLKHTPTYVDESLFGNGLEEPSFEAPWNERKKGEKKKQRPYLWDPSGEAEINGHNGIEISLSGKNVRSRSTKRPATSLGISRNKDRGGPLPVWKP